MTRHCIRRCRRCDYQASPTVGTLFENTRLPLHKWFAAIYLMSAGKGGISAERVRKMIGVTWRTAQLMLDKLRRAMANQDRQYVLGLTMNGCVELDDAFWISSITTISLSVEMASSRREGLALKLRKSSPSFN